MSGGPKKFNLYVFRYTEDVVRGESVGIAIFLVEQSRHAGGFKGFESLRDWSRLKSLCPNADVDAIKSWCTSMAVRLLAPRNSRKMPTRQSLAMNFSIDVERHAVESLRTPDEELSYLARVYLG